MPPVEKALRVPGGAGTPAAPAAAAAPRRPPEKVRAEIEEVAEQYGAEEVMVVTITFDHAARLRSYELIAEAFGLEREPAGAGAAQAG